VVDNRRSDGSLSLHRRPVRDGNGNQRGNRRGAATAVRGLSPAEEHGSFSPRRPRGGSQTTQLSDDWARDRRRMRRACDRSDLRTRRNRQGGGCEYGPALCGGAVVQSPPRQHQEDRGKQTPAKTIIVGVA
jgi:hypothetical protein